MMQNFVDLVRVFIIPRDFVYLSREFYVPYKKIDRKTKNSEKFSPLFHLSARPQI